MALDSQAKGLDFYKTLGVDRHASAKDISTAYRRLAFKFREGTGLHPDPAIAEKLKDLNQAHEVLSDERSRKAYDRIYDAGIQVVVETEVTNPNQRQPGVVYWTKDGPVMNGEPYGDFKYANPEMGRDPNAIRYEDVYDDRGKPKNTQSKSQDTGRSSVDDLSKLFPKGDRHEGTSNVGIDSATGRERGAVPFEDYFPNKR
ncbi:DnaJ domain-containing protein [Candidatus Microgenomates bacterium]|nr:DnaJ domain-containing protein [Candidatus Microgenomates bacterium]